MNPNLAYIEGREARKGGKGRDACDYAPNTAEYWQWNFGWSGADGFAMGEDWHARGLHVEHYDGAWGSLHHGGFLAGYQQALQKTLAADAG